MKWNKWGNFFREVINSFIFLGELYEKYSTIKSLLSEIDEQPQLDKIPTVVFNTVRSRAIHFDIELFLAYQLALRGAMVKVLVDDGLMAHWDYEQLQHINRGLKMDPYYRLYEGKKTFSHKMHEQWYLLLHRIYKKTYQKAYEHKNLEVVNYSDLIDTDTGKLEISEYDVDQAYSSTKRFFECGQIDLNKKEHHWYFNKSQKNCLLSKKIGQKIFRQLNPDLFITSHGIYSTWGPCYEFMKAKGIKTLIWALHCSRNKKIILADDIIQLISNDSDWRQKKQKKLTLSEKAFVHKQFEARLKHSTNDTQIYFKNLKREKSTEDFDFTKDKMVYGLFPNVVWDGNICERDTLFKHLIDWIEFTIDKFKDSDNVLVIRFHPSETTMLEGSKKLREILLERNTDLKSYKNIKLISSDAKVDTYAFAKQYVDIGLIYSGTLALELTHMNIPVISCSNSFYHRADCCFEPQTKEDYAHYLLNGASIIKSFSEKKEIIHENLEKFAYWYFYDVAYEVPILARDHIYKFCYEDLEPKDVDPSRNTDLSVTIRKILSTVKDFNRPDLGLAMPKQSKMRDLKLS